MSKSVRTQFLISNYSPGWIAVSKLQFRMPALAAALDELGGRDGSAFYLIPADRRADVEAILDTSDLIPILDRAREDAEAATYGLVRADQPERGSHPLGRKVGTVPGGTVYADSLGEGTVTIYDRS